MNRRVAIVLLLSLLPWPAVYYGMYVVHNLIWTFFLYHGVCLLPAVVWGRQLWLPHVVRPGGRNWVVATVAAALTCVVAVFAYVHTGKIIVSSENVINVLTSRGFDAAYMLPLGIYFVVVNPTLEELFWRGVVLNELDYVDEKWKYVGAAWTAITFGAWHYLVLRALLQPGWAELATAGVMLVGVFCSELYRRTQSIVMPIIWHALVFDLAIIVLFVVIVRGA